MATLTHPSHQELSAFLQTYGFDNKIAELHAITAGSVNSNFSVETAGERYFLRLYEERDAKGAADDLDIVHELAARGVLTPTPLRGARELAGRPAALFPWVEGMMRCQRSVAPRDAHTIGRALADLHKAAAGIESEGRFHPAGLYRRLDDIASRAPGIFPVERLRRALDDLTAPRDGVPTGLIHGDLFRDNVLWQGERLVAVLDFESSATGPLVLDLAITILAWCFGDGFSRDLARNVVSGYELVRPLEARELRAFFAEVRFACIRFVITRITDYALRDPSKQGVMKDWRRFLSRLDALEAMGPAGLGALIR